MAKTPDPGGFQPIEVPTRDHTALPGFRPIEVDHTPRPAPDAKPARRAPKAKPTPAPKPSDAPAPANTDTAETAEKEA